MSKLGQNKLGLNKQGNTVSGVNSRRVALRGPTARAAAGVLIAAMLCMHAGAQVQGPQGQATPPESARAQPARTGEARCAILSGLRERVLAPVSMDAAELVGVDSSTGERVRIPLSDLLALLPVMADGAEVAPRTTPVPTRVDLVEAVGVVEFADGQLVPGVVGAPSSLASPDELPWSSQRVGEVHVSLEGLASITLAESPAHEQTVSEETVSEDTVRLRNADVLRGFVQVIADPAREALGVHVETAGPAAAPGDAPKGEQAGVRVPFSRVASILCANPRTRTGGAWLWLDDGAALAVENLTQRDGKVLATWRAGAAIASASSEASKRLVMDAPVVSGFAPDTSRIDSLAHCALLGSMGSEGRRWATPPAVHVPRGAPLGDGDVTLRGPIAAAWNVGEGVVRIAGTIEMLEGDRVWGDCEVVLERVSVSDDPLHTAGQELFRARLRDVSPKAAFNVAWKGKQGEDPSTTLRVRVIDSGNGPAQDRAVLRRVLIERAPSAK